MKPRRLRRASRPAWRFARFHARDRRDRLVLRPIEEDVFVDLVRVDADVGRRLVTDYGGDLFQLFGRGRHRERDGAGADLGDGGHDLSVGEFTGVGHPATDGGGRRGFGTGQQGARTLALAAFEDAKGRLPAAALYSKDGKPLLSWRVQILPYLGHQELYNRFRHNESWDSEHNRKLFEHMPDVIADPRALQDRRM